MRRKLLIALLLLPVALSCIEKDPSWKLSWETGGSWEETPLPPQPPQEKPDTTVEIIPTDVPLQEAFSQDFNTSDTAPFARRLHKEGDDFRYFPGFPSLSEAKTDILLLRLDPHDTPEDCPCIEASAHTFYGSYSLRVRTPDLSRVKKTTDAVLEFGLRGNDPAAGVSGIAVKWALSAPAKMTITSLAGTPDSQTENSVEVMFEKSLDLSAKFQTCGWDWTPDYVRWWILDASTKEKTIIGEISGQGEVPSLPAVLSLSVSHSSDAPEYPFETEIDKISYEPFPDHIRAWREKYFEK